MAAIVLGSVSQVSAVFAENEYDEMGDIEEKCEGGKYDFGC